jgi:hypothetical protein
MAEPAPATPLQLLGDDAAGYCDPVSGTCALPAAVPSESQDDAGDAGGAGGAETARRA